MSEDQQYERAIYQELRTLNEEMRATKKQVQTIKDQIALNVAIGTLGAGVIIAILLAFLGLLAG